MDSKEILQNLLYINEHLSCNNYLPEVDLGFTCCEPSEKIIVQSDYVSRNYLFFFIEGKASVSCNQFCNRTFNAGEMVMIPRSAKLCWEADKGSLVLILGFNTPQNPCDKFDFQSLGKLSSKIKYDFQPLPIRYPLTKFNEVLIFLLKNKMNCGHLHILKQQELFFILRGFYTKEELAILFYPIICKDMDFKDLIVKNSKNVNNINELIERSCMGKSNFHEKFREVFGMTAKQWMLKQKEQMVQYEMSKPKATIKDVMAACGFDSPAMFNQFCRQRFGSTPKVLIEQYQSNIEENIEKKSTNGENI